MLLEKVIGSSVLSNKQLISNKDGSIIYKASACIVSPVIIPSSQSSNNNSNQSLGTITSQKAISCMTWSMDNKYIALGERGKDPKCIVWNVSSNSNSNNMSNHKLYATLANGHKYGIGCVSISPDNKYIITVGYKHDKTLIIWDLSQQTKLIIQKLSNKVYSIAYHSTGQYFVTCGDRHLKYWTLNTPLSHNDNANAYTLTSKPAAILEELSDSVFMEALFYPASTKGHNSDHSSSQSKRHNLYVITSKAILCQFSETKYVENYMQLEQVDSAYCLAWIGDKGHNSDGYDDMSSLILVVGCSQGVIYLILPNTFECICQLILPLSSPHNYDLSPTLQNSTLSHDTDLNLPNTLLPACYALTVHLQKSTANTLLVASYSDKSMYTYDMTELCTLLSSHTTRNSDNTKMPLSEVLLSSAYRAPIPSLLSSYHSACVWDLQFLSTPAPTTTAATAGQGYTPVPHGEGSFITCSVDNTLRVWSYTDGEGNNNVTTVFHLPSSTSKLDSDNADATNLMSSPLDLSMSYMTAGTTSTSAVGDGLGALRSPSGTLATSGALTGLPDFESPDHSQSDGHNSYPRVLTQHPSLPHIICGHRSGELTVHQLPNMRIIQTISAHTAEVLSLHCSPPMRPVEGHSGEWAVDTGKSIYDASLHVISYFY